MNDGWLKEEGFRVISVVDEHFSATFGADGQPKCLPEGIAENGAVDVWRARCLVENVAAVVDAELGVVSGKSGMNERPQR